MLKLYYTDFSKNEVMNLNKLAIIASCNEPVHITNQSQSEPSVNVLQQFSLPVLLSSNAIHYFDRLSKSNQITFNIAPGS